VASKLNGEVIGAIAASARCPDAGKATKACAAGGAYDYGHGSWTPLAVTLAAYPQEDGMVTASAAEECRLPRDRGGQHPRALDPSSGLDRATTRQRSCLEFA